MVTGLGTGLGSQGIVVPPLQSQTNAFMHKAFVAIVRLIALFNATDHEKAEEVQRHFHPPQLTTTESDRRLEVVTFLKNKERSKCEVELPSLFKSGEKCVTY